MPSKSNRRGHVGPSYSPESLRAEQDHSLERAVLSAVRIMEERAVLLRRLRKDTRQALIGGGFGRRADELEKDARMLRILINGQ